MEIVAARDGLPASVVGAWVADKTQVVRDYVGATRKARAKFLGPGNAGATYIELFCGPGLSVVKDSGEEHDGSVLAAVSESMREHAFSEVHLADESALFAEAACKRVVARGFLGRVERYSGSALLTARVVKAALKTHSLHFVFLDPFSLSDLDFELISTLAPLRHVDILVHISTSDLQRNLDAMISSEDDRFDRFAPGWREHVDPRQPQGAMRRDFLAYWRAMVGKLGLSVNDEVRHVQGSRNQSLYYLALLSRSSTAHEIWEKIAQDRTQRSLDF